MDRLMQSKAQTQPGKKLCREENFFFDTTRKTNDELHVIWDVFYYFEESTTSHF